MSGGGGGEGHSAGLSLTPKWHVHPNSSGNWPGRCTQGTSPLLTNIQRDFQDLRCRVSQETQYLALMVTQAHLGCLSYPLASRHKVPVACPGCFWVLRYCWECQESAPASAAGDTPSIPFPTWEPVWWVMGSGAGRNEQHLPASRAGLSWLRTFLSFCSRCFTSS